MITTPAAIDALHITRKCVVSLCSTLTEVSEDSVDTWSDVSRQDSACCDVFVLHLTGHIVLAGHA